MSLLEDRVRRALRETAEEITPLNVPPLRLPPRGGRGSGASRLRSRPAGWPGWLTPLAAAAAVAAVLAATLALTGTLSGHRPADRGRPVKTLRGLPRFYIVLADTGGGAGQRAWRQQAVVRATATSQVVAMLTPPQPDNAFLMVAAAGGGRYVLAAQRIEFKRVGHGSIPGHRSAIRFYQVRIGSSGQVSPLRLLPVPALPSGTYLDGLALTPDGRKLAVASQAAGPGGVPEIQVDTLATGARRVWTWPGGQPVRESTGGTGSAVSWAADDRTLAFQRLVGSQIQVRLLDTAAPGSSLAASRVAVSRYWDGSVNSRFRHGRAVNDIMMFGTLLTPDGSKIVCATDTETQRPQTDELAFTEFSARTGKVVAQLGRWRITGHWPTEIQEVLWTNADGSTLLVVAHQPGVTVDSQGGFPIQFGVLRGNRYTPLPGAPNPDKLDVWPAW